MKSNLTDLNRLLARQNFKDEKELQAFLNNLTGKSLYDLPKMDLTPEEQAEDLVYEAYNLTPAKAKKNIEKALELDKNCIDAYEYLAAIEKKLEKKLEILEKGIAIGRKKFGGKFLKENRGNFWGIHETRPFMRCLQHKADMLWLLRKGAECAAVYEEMFELNDGDNQGVRFPLMSVLILLDEIEKFKKYDKIFADDCSMSMLYSRALFAFKTEGDTAKSRKAAKEAFEANNYVIAMLTDKNFQFSGVSGYTMGSPEEAEVYLLHAFFAWHETDNAIEWFINTVINVLNKEEQKVVNGSSKNHKSVIVPFKNRK